MTFTQRRNRLTTHFSERFPVVKRRMTVNIKMQFVPRRKHCVWVEKRLMMHRGITDLRCENHTEHIRAFCGQNVGFIIVNPGGT